MIVVIHIDFSNDHIPSVEVFQETHFAMRYVKQLCDEHGLTLTNKENDCITYSYVGLDIMDDHEVRVYDKPDFADTLV